MNYKNIGAAILMAPLDWLLRQFRGAPIANRAAIGGAMAMPLSPGVRPMQTRHAHKLPLRAKAAGSLRRQVGAPLRVVRVVEADQASMLAGRIMMSGRLADVCAELDRMVEREAGMQASG